MSSSHPDRQNADLLADLLIVGGTVVTMDAAHRLIDDGAVAIRGDSILAVGKRSELSAQYAAQKTLDARGALILPGLINGHAHAAMSLFRGLADDLALDEWLQKHIFPAEAHNVNEEFVARGTRLSVLEMLRGGITTYADMYYFEDVVARVTKEAGMRGILGETIVDFPAPDNKTPAEALAYAQDYITKWKSDPLISPAVAPHAIYTCSEKTLLDSAALARRNQVPILIHISEALFEIEQSRKKQALSPVSYLGKIGFLGPDVVAAHCIWVDAADVALLKHFSVGCIHNPSSNMKLASGVMPVIDFPRLRPGGRPCHRRRRQQQQPGHLRGNGHRREIAENRPHGPARPARRAGGRDGHPGRRPRPPHGQVIGSLEPGKKADVIFVDTSGPHATPMYDVYSQLVYALRGSDVKTVIVGGKLLMENHHMLTLDEEQILREAREYQKKLSAWAKTK
jgi:5-methylthioadenosine/S-adenosylhomocysteine deaminase